MLRGEIFLAEIINPSNTHIQLGKRPWVIVQNNFANTHSPVITAIPLTSKLYKKPAFPTHCYVVPLNYTNTYRLRKSIALCEQIITLDKLPEYHAIGKITQSDLNKIDHCLKIALGLEVPKNGLL